MVSYSPRLKTVTSTVRSDKPARVEEVVDYVPLRSTLPKEYADNPFMTPGEIAKEESVDPKTVSRWTRKGKFGQAPDVIFLPGGTHRRIRRSAYLRAKAEVNSRYGA